MLPALYHIVTGIPVRGEMSGFSFSIRLWPAWKEATARRALTHENIENWKENLAERMLDACGYSQLFDGRRLYDKHSIRIAWGEWGPEHVTIPGNGCGLDLCNDSLHAPKDGRVLLTHNVDTIQQAYLLQLIFNWFANDLVCFLTIDKVSHDLISFIAASEQTTVPAGHPSS